MSEITKALFLSFLLIMLCETSFSQSIFYLDKDYVHGLGVAAYNEELPDTTITQACESSIQDLQSNIFLSVYIEIFQENGASYYEFPEFSILDSTITYKKDSHLIETEIYDGFVYCFTSDDQFSQNYLSNVPSLESLELSPVNKNGIWYALGSYTELVNNRNKAWLLSKNDAANRLSKTKSTSVQTKRVQINNDNTSFTYLKTNIIYTNLVVVQRIIKDGKYISIIAVKEEDITTY